MAYKAWLIAALMGATLILAGCEKPSTEIRAMDDAAHARIGVMSGTTGEAVARQRFPQAELHTFQDVMDAVAALNAGKLDVVVTAFPTANLVAKKNPALQVFPEPLRSDDTSVAVRKGDAALLAQIDHAIGEFKNDGTLQSAHRRWFKTGLEPYDEIDIPVATAGVPLLSLIHI